MAKFRRRITEDYREIIDEKSPKSPERARDCGIGHRPIREYSGELQERVWAYVKER
jgi:hypothetical protein